MKGKYEKTTKRLQYVDSEKSKNTIEGQKIMIQKGKLNASAHFFLKIQEIIYNIFLINIIYKASHSDLMYPKCLSSYPGLQES